MRDASEELAVRMRFEFFTRAGGLTSLVVMQPKRSRRIIIYIVAGLVSVFVIIYASIALVHGYGVKGAEDGVDQAVSPHSSPVATSETSLKSGSVSRGKVSVNHMVQDPNAIWSPISQHGYRFQSH